MKKILLVGKFNTVVQEMNRFLAQFFHVQLCSEHAGVLEGMMKIVEPDLVLISLIGAYDIDTSIFFMLSERYGQIPVLTIATKEESSAFFKYYESSLLTFIIPSSLMNFFISPNMYGTAYVEICTSKLVSNLFIAFINPIHPI